MRRLRYILIVEFEPENRFGSELIILQELSDYIPYHSLFSLK
jgi:hypothetical protein